MIIDTSTLKSISGLQAAISALESLGVDIAEETGECFSMGDSEYIPKSSDEFEDYAWIRELHGLSNDSGFWYSSSMQDC